MKCKAICNVRNHNEKVERESLKLVSSYVFIMIKHFSYSPVVLMNIILLSLESDSFTKSGILNSEESTADLSIFLDYIATCSLTYETLTQ
jgi:hypothetical protein